jgi:hypothetical protein
MNRQDTIKYKMVLMMARQRVKRFEKFCDAISEMFSDACVFIKALAISCLIIYVLALIFQVLWAI